MRIKLRNVTESVNFLESEGSVSIQGVLARGDMVNANRRFYPTSDLVKAVERVQDAVAAGKVIGLSDHPGEGGGLKGSPRNTVVKWEEIWMDGNDMLGRGVLLDTAAGRDVKALHDAGVHVGLSTNGRGSREWRKASDLGVAVEGVSGDDYVAVITDFELLTIDVVNDPSNVFAALQREAVSESREYREGLEVIMTVKELREKHPELVEELFATASVEDLSANKAFVESRKVVDGDKALSDELVRSQARVQELESKLKLSSRESIVIGAVSNPNLPALEKQGEIDLNALFENQVRKAVMDAESDEEAQKVADAMVAERVMLFGESRSVRGGNNGLPAGRSKVTAVKLPGVL